MTAPLPINLAEKLASFSDHWNPRVVGSYNSNDLRLVKLQGDFTWHAHPDTDELFLVIAGEMAIEFKDTICRLKAGDCIVVPRGTAHRPFAETEAHVLLMDREGEPNTGDTPSERTRAVLEAI